MTRTNTIKRCATWLGEQAEDQRFELTELLERFMRTNSQGVGPIDESGFAGPDPPAFAATPRGTRLYVCALDR
jgi:hypothetical protein